MEITPMTSNTDAPELLPCPFCGGKAATGMVSEGMDFAFCKTCRTETPRVFGSRREAVAAWNTRDTRQQAEAVGAAYEAAAIELKRWSEPGVVLEYDLEDEMKAIRALTPSDAAAALERVKREAQEALIPALASLAAAISLLERSPKTAAPSDKMFDQMLDDYRKSLEEARSVLQKGTPDAP